MDIDRRNLLKLTGFGVASMYFGGCSSLGSQLQGNTEFGLAEMSPFDRRIGNIGPRLFSGDQPDFAHEILWDKDTYLKTHPLQNPTEEADLVIVGGGMSGLVSAHFLQQHNPIILEQAERFGGNSRGESWQGLDYTLATAYFGVPISGTPIHNFFNDIGMNDKYRIKSGSDPIFIDGNRIDDVWATGSNSKNKKQFVKLSEHFQKMLANEDGLRYPNMPPETDEERTYLNELDKISFRQYVEKVLGEPIDSHVDHVLDHYFWSACASSHRETSAALGLNFFVGDFDKVAVAKGGNGAIAEATLNSLWQKLPHGNFRASSLVYDIRVVGNKVHVHYVDSKKKTKVIAAKSVVMSCPKFVAAKLINNLEPARLAAIEKLQYRSYLVTNVLVNKHIEDNFYDLFFFSDEVMKMNDVKMAAKAQKMTDFIHGSYTQAQAPQTVLTFFQGFPYAAVRKEIYDKNFYTKVRSEMETQIYNIISKIGLSKNDVADIRLSRWGHPLPLGAVGNLAKGIVDEIRKPFQDRIFFVEQDNWTMPSFESCFHEARYFSDKINRFLSV